MNKKLLLIIILAVVFSVAVFTGSVFYFQRSADQKEAGALEEAKADVAIIQEMLNEYYEVNNAYPNFLNEFDLGDAEENSIEGNYTYAYRSISSGQKSACGYALQAKIIRYIDDSGLVMFEVNDKECLNN